MKIAAGEEAAEESYAAALHSIEHQIAAFVEKADQQGHELRLYTLAERFGLDGFDLDALLLCLAPALDLRYEQIYGYLRDDMTLRHPSVDLVLDVLCPPGPGRLSLLPRFAPQASLRRHHLVETVEDATPGTAVLLGQALVVDPVVVSWLLGTDQPHPRLAACSTLVAEPAVQDGLLTAAQHAAITQAAAQDAVVVMAGRDEWAQEIAAETFAGHLGWPLSILDLAGVGKKNQDFHEILQLFLRDARLASRVAFVRGWDSCVVDGVAPRELVAALDEHPGPVLVGSSEVWRLALRERRRRWLWLDFPRPDYVQSRQLLADWLSDLPAQEALDEEALAGRFSLTTGEWQEVVHTAADRAAQQQRLVTNEDLFLAARSHASPRLGILARKIEPRFTWPDLILPDDQITRLREIVDMVRGQPRAWEEWHVRRKLAAGNGVSALFAGPPGTGKTMAAEVIAHVLGLDLYKIDLSTMVSKYIGETEKNLERIFVEAEHSNAILFFDEADAIFGKRSEVKDAHDRYANIEVSYLLQRMETYDGITVLATNLRSNLDEAFTRRLQMIVDFPFPDVPQRLRIWTTLFPPDAPRADDIDFDLSGQTLQAGRRQHPQHHRACDPAGLGQRPAGDDAAVAARRPPRAAKNGAPGRRARFQSDPGDFCLNIMPLITGQKTLATSPTQVELGITAGSVRAVRTRRQYR